MDFYYFDTGGISYDPINLNVVLTFHKHDQGGEFGIMYITTTDQITWVFANQLQRDIIFDQLVGLSTRLIP